MTDESPLQPLTYIPGNILCAQDYEWAARQFMRSPTYAYINGGSARDATAKANIEAFNNWAVTPRLLGEVSSLGTAITLLGQNFAHPILLAPVAYQTLAHPLGELETARAAAATDSGLIASTLSSFSLEEIAKSNPRSPLWFQLYFQDSQEITLDLVRRAERTGYQAIVVTLDASIKMPSMSAQRAGFTMPPEVRAENFANYANQVQHTNGSQDVLALVRPHANHWQKLEWLLKQTSLPIIVKGVMHGDDAIKLKSMGIAAVVVSNHGGRGLDGAPATLDVLRQIRLAVGNDFPLIFDGGIRSGLDIFKALALGADAILIGRLQIYALSVAGALGVAHMIKLLRQELEVVMAMTACFNLAEIRQAKLLRNQITFPN